MAPLTKTAAGRWKAVIRRQGWPTSSKTWRTKRDAEDWARRTEDEMARGIHQNRAPAERTTLSGAIDRYLSDVPPPRKKALRKPNEPRQESCMLLLANTASSPSRPM